MSDTRWRQITAGQVRIGDTVGTVRAPAETLARMAAVVGVTASDLAEWGRPDAAEAMVTLGAVAPDADVLRRQIELAAISDQVKRLLLAALDMERSPTRMKRGESA